MNTLTPPKTIAEQFLDDVEAFLGATGMNPTQFGKRAMKDPKFVFDLRDGRSCGSKTMDRVRLYIAENTPQAAA